MTDRPRARSARVIASPAAAAASTMAISYSPGIESRCDHYFTASREAPIALASALGDPNIEMTWRAFMPALWGHSVP